MIERLAKFIVLVAVAAVMAAGCATGRAFARGEAAGRAGDWEAAVGVLPAGARRRSRSARLQDRARAGDGWPRRRCMPSAAGSSKKPASSKRRCAPIARRRSSSRRTGSSSAKAAQIDRTLRDRIEAATPRPDIERLRQQAARRTVEPILSPTNPEPLIVNFVNTSLRDILTFIGNYTGINVTFDRDFQDRSVTVRMEGVSLEQALQQIMIVERPVLSRPQRAHHHRRGRSDAEAPAVRRAGDSHVLHLACRRLGAEPAADGADPRGGHGDPAADLVQQDRPTPSPSAPPRR